MAGKMIFQLTVQCIVICSLSKFTLSLKECKKIDQCSCSTDEGQISLKNLARTDGKPRFQHIPDSDSNSSISFSWNPCDSYSLYGGCVDVAACLNETLTYFWSMFWGVANQNTADCVLGKNGECILTYTGAALFRNSTFTVSLQCHKALEGRVDPVVSDFAENKYSTSLYSKYACPTSSSSGSSSSGLSTGSILIITFSCLIIAYIVCGILVNKYARQVEGKEVFPNYSFWADFPYLIKDGCVFTFHSLGRICGKGPSRGGYASI